MSTSRLKALFGSVSPARSSTFSNGRRFFDAHRNSRLTSRFGSGLSIAKCKELLVIE